MALFNYIPGVAHVKAGIHLICNDKEGAVKTLDTLHTKAPIYSHLVAGIAKVTGNDKLALQAWDGGNSSLNALPVVGHIKGLGHYICGDIKGGNQAMVDATVTTSNIADGIPVVGHVKGVVHYACGDVDGGNKAMKASTRTTTVMAAGAGGFVVAGPVGAVAGGVTAGGGWDVTVSVVSDGKEANGIAKIITNPTSVDSYFDAALSLVGDGLTGYSGGKIAESATKTANSNTSTGVKGKEIVAGEVKDVPSMEPKLDAVNPKQNVPTKVKAGQLDFYSDEFQSSSVIEPKNGLLNEQRPFLFSENGPINEQRPFLHSENGPIPKQYTYQVNNNGEIAKAGSSQTTIVIVSSSDEGFGANNDNKEQKKEGSKENNEKDKQPPQQPPNIQRNSNNEARILELRSRLTDLLNRIRQHRVQDPMLLDRQFQIESFQEIFKIVFELILSGHIIAITSENLNLAIFSRDGSWREVIEYQLADYLDVHDQLFNQRYPLNPDISCPTILSAQFLGSQLVLSHQTNHYSDPAIYGIRCRLCDRRAGPCNINYVGLTKRSAHVRVCGEHARAARDLINSGVDNGKGSTRPMYKHVAEHEVNGDLPEGTQARDAFRQVMDVILLPISGGPDELRSWEAFWQFFLHCRKFFWGWSQR